MSGALITLRDMEFARGTLCDYERFACLHYRRDLPAFVSDVFVLKGIEGEDAGIITYSYPPANCAARNRIFTQLPRERSERLRRINLQFRIVSRVVIVPEYRGLGLAGMFLRQSAGFVNAGCIEALSASQAGAGLFESAGFTRSEFPENPQKKRLIGELKKCELPLELNAGEDRRIRMDMLSSDEHKVVLRRCSALLGAYGRLRTIEEPLERLEAAVKKLHCNPEYFYLLKAQKRKEQDA